MGEEENFLSSEERAGVRSWTNDSNILNGLNVLNQLNCFSPQFRCRVLHRLDDFGVAGAAAKVAG